MALLLVLIAGFFSFEGLGYLIHRLLHSPIGGPLHRAHMAHHAMLYPPWDFLSDRYRSAGAESTTYRFAAFALVIAVAIALVFPLHYSLPLVAELAIVGLVNSYLHDSFHIRGHWLERSKIFLKWRELHKIHHFDMSRNFGIYTFLADRVVGTFSDVPWLRDGRQL